MFRLTLVLFDISCYIFSYLVDNRNEMLEVNTKLTPIISSVHVDENEKLINCVNLLPPTVAIWVQL